MKAQQVSVRRIGIGLAAAVALLTSGCAAGQYAQTATENETLDGTTVKVGDITVGGLAIETPKTTKAYPAGSAVPVKVVIVNSGRQDDTLTSISSPSITEWGAYGSAAAYARAASRSAGAPSVGTSSPSGSASRTKAPAAGPTPKTSIPIGGLSRVSYGTPDAKGALILSGIKSTLFPGMSISLTFTFDRAGTVTVQVPVQLSATPQTSVIPAPSTGAGEG